MNALPRGVAAGWLMFGFLGGVGVHCLAPEYLWRLHEWLVYSVLWVGVGAVWFFVRTYDVRRELIIAIGILIGLWRFQNALPQAPRGLIPFDTRSLASADFSTQTANVYDPRHWMGQVRIEFTQRANALFAPDEAALLIGILYGDKQLSPDLKNVFRRVGISHIIAVSGSNVTIVISCLLGPLLWVGFSRPSAYVTASIGIFLFVLLALPSASVVRAAVMGWLLLTAPMVGRLPCFQRLMLIAAVAYTAWQPWSLMYDPSFALSFLAMFGLGSFGRLLDEWLQPRLKSELFREIITSSVGATMLTTPYGLWAFRQVSFVGIAANLCVLPFVSWTMGFGALALLFPRWNILAWPARGCLRVMLEVSRWFSALPFASASKLSTSFDLMIGMYVGLYFIWSLLQRKKRVIHFAKPT